MFILTRYKHFLIQSFEIPKKVLLNYNFEHALLIDIASIFHICLGHEKVIKLLIENGAHVNVNCTNGQTPLYMAITYGMPQMSIIQFIAKNAHNSNFNTH